MKLILDEGIPLRTAEALRGAGVDARHVLELRMGGAADQAILDKAKLDGAAVVTLDADFHQILANTQAGQPSVIRVRVEGLGYQQFADLLLDVLKRAGQELSDGAAVSAGVKQMRIRKLPLRG